jgi:hypothetical protein
MIHPPEKNASIGQKKLRKFAEKIFRCPVLGNFQAHLPSHYTIWMGSRSERVSFDKRLDKRLPESARLRESLEYYDA